MAARSTRAGPSSISSNGKSNCLAFSRVNIIRLLLSARASLAVVAAVLIFAAVPGAVASSGDETLGFQSCVAACRSTGCAIYGPDGQHKYQTSGAANLNGTVDYCSPLCDRNKFNTPDLWLKLNHWDCTSDCQYRCMWLVEDTKKNQTPERVVEKYFGKWPFLRAFGAQEPASVITSLANLAANMYCLVRTIKQIGLRSHHSHRLRPQTRIFPWLYLGHFAISCNAWLWSAVFHCRDTRITERLDYFSAGALVAFNLFISLARVATLTSTRSLFTLGGPIFTLYIYHVHRMLTVLFDYGLHVGLCVGAGALQTAAWAAWALCSKTGRAHPGRTALLKFMAAVNFATLLEILDFPPLWKVLDAHALWHAATAPLTLLWYKFVATDIDLLMGQSYDYFTLKSSQKTT